MKIALRILLASLALPALPVLNNSLSAQPFGHPKRTIIFSPVNSGMLLFLKEQGGIYYNLSDSGMMQHSTISNIHNDTVWFDGKHCQVKNIEQIGFATQAPSFQMMQTGHSSIQCIYSRKDSSRWHIFYPPDSIYKNKFTYDDYLHRVKGFLHREKADKINNPLVYNNILKINLMKLFHLEFAVAYEFRMAKNVSFEIETGYLIGVRSADASYQFNYPLYNYNGFTFLAYPKIYLGSIAYLGITCQYRHLWFNGVRTYYPDDGSGGGYLQDQVRNDIGGALRFGLEKRYGRFIVDWYVGGGVKFVYIDQVLYGFYEYHDSNEYVPYPTPRTGYATKLEPIINFGIKIGAGF